MLILVKIFAFCAPYRNNANVYVPQVVNICADIDLNNIGLARRITYILPIKFTMCTPSRKSWQQFVCYNDIHKLVIKRKARIAAIPFLIRLILLCFVMKEPDCRFDEHIEVLYRRYQRVRWHDVRWALTLERVPHWKMEKLYYRGHVLRLVRPLSQARRSIYSTLLPLRRTHSNWKVSIIDVAFIDFLRLYSPVLKIVMGAYNKISMCLNANACL